MNLTSHFKLSGWVFPSGVWFNCKPWEHIKEIKNHPYFNKLKENNKIFKELWNNPDEELLRIELAKIGMIKVCYYHIDANNINHLQLKTLQTLFSITTLDEDIEFIGKIRLKIPIRLFLKIKDPERLNHITQF